MLTDSSGRHVGFEMKASIAVDPRDIAGLQAFRASKKLHRGFVVYRGAQLLPLAPGIWALPVAALLDG